MTSSARLAVAALVALLSACSAPSTGTMQGIVIDVEGSLTTVTGFTVLVDGEPVTFEASAEGDYAFPLGHLRDHIRTGEPVRVGWRMDGERRVATSLDDA
jgi:hypothetical protein